MILSTQFPQSNTEITRRPRDDSRFIQQYSDRVAELALTCITTEFPNALSYARQKKYISFNLEDTPYTYDSFKALNPAFYGSFDWHSCVHNHWALLRILRLQPDTRYRQDIIDQLNKSLNPEDIAKEVSTFESPLMGRGYELPYGFSWLLQLTSELRQCDFQQADSWLKALLPLEELVLERLQTWMVSINEPLRMGMHNNTAFNLGLIRDWTLVCENSLLLQRVDHIIHGHFINDTDAPILQEPDSCDFISPSLTVADLMRRILPEQEFAQWLEHYLPDIPPVDEPWLDVLLSAGEDTHLFGLNLSRAWMLEGIARALPEHDPRIPTLEKQARNHEEAGMAILLEDINFLAAHWLPTFAVYLLTERGISTRF